MGDKLKKLAVKTGYGDSIGSQLIAKVDLLEQYIAELEADRQYQGQLLIKAANKVIAMKAKLATFKRRNHSKRERENP